MLIRLSVFVSAVAVAVAVVLLAGCAAGNNAASNADGSAAGAGGKASVERLAAMMVGTYSSAEQAAEDPEYRVIELHMVRAWRERTDGVWLYVEQAAATAREKPYRQRVYRLTDLGGGVLKSEVFTLPGDPLRFAGEWKRPNPLPDVKVEELTLRDGCALTLTAGPDGAFAGSTNGSDCASELNGARYATSSARITGKELISWDQGFDAMGKQVWGATKGGYIFKKALPW